MSPNWQGSIVSFLERNDGRLFLGIAGIVLFVKILLKILNALKKVDWSTFLNPTLVGTLLVVVLVYVGLLILACYWSRILEIPASFIFLILPFLLYCLLLTNSLSFCCADQTVLLGALGFLILGAWFWGRDLPEKNIAGPKRDSWAYLLIGIFVIHGILLFLGQNFRADRVPFADESTFWFSAAKEMLSKGFLAAHQEGYPGGGLHPFGVPFLNALPGMLVHIVFPEILFYMPIYIIFGLTLVLLEFVATQRSKWGIVFFLTVWFASFNNKSWAGTLFYSMVYGESVCMVLVVSLLCWFANQKKFMIGGSWTVAAFLLGLLVLTKFPFILLSVGFLLAFLIRFGDGSKGLKRVLLMAAIFVVPFIILKLFQMKYGGVISSLGGVSLNRLFLPNTDMLWRVIDNIAIDADNLWYYFLIAAGMSVFSYKQWSYGWPVFLWVLFLLIYYAYIYAYGAVGAGDAGSGLRYFLPAATGFFFLGASGVGGLVDIIQRQRNQLFRVGLYVAFLTIILYKLF